VRLYFNEGSGTVLRIVRWWIGAGTILIVPMMYHPVAPSAVRSLSGVWNWQSAPDPASGTFTFSAVKSWYTGIGYSTGDTEHQLRVDSATVRGDSVRMTIVDPRGATSVSGTFTSDTTISGRWSAGEGAAGTFTMQRRPR
jgi:hypothetical protein